MADEQTPTPQDPNVSEAPQLVVPPGESGAVSDPQPASGQENAPATTSDAPSGTTPESIPPPGETEGFGPNPPADPSLAQRESELKQQGVENPPTADQLADPNKAPEDLPPGVVVGGAPVSEAAPHDGTEPGDDKFEPAKLSDQPGPGTVTVQPVRVDGRNRRDDGDALEGHFVKVRNEDHDGKIAAYVSTVEHSAETGYPTRALVRFKDTDYTHEYAVVDYQDLEPMPIEKAGG